MLFQLEIRNDVLSRLQRASPSSHQTMMICADTLLTRPMGRLYIYIYIYNRPIGLVSSVRERPRRLRFNPRSSHNKTSKMELDTALLNTQHYTVRIKSKVGQLRERSSALPYTSV